MSLEKEIKRLTLIETIREKRIAPESEITKALREQLRKEIDGRRYG